MYHLVLYNISPIQQGIQAYHAGIEYSLKYGDSKEYKQWSKKDKTVIILNGGVSNRGANYIYDKKCIESHYFSLQRNNIPVVYFNEPDLNDATTALAFLVDETVWDKEKYPDPTVIVKYNDEIFYNSLKEMYGEKVAFLRTWLPQFRLA